MIRLDSISKRHGRRILLLEASAVLNRGEKAALVGPNGAGKTTIFRLVTREEQPDDGQVSIDRGVTVGYFSQDVGEMAGKSVVAETMDGAGPVSAIVGEMRELELALADPDRAGEMDALLERLGAAQTRFEELDGWALDSRAREILAGLGFAQDVMDADVATLSGGWKMRVALARILLQRPDVLLLDEPTNHLDVDAKNWLMGFLRTYRGALLVISHDLDLLDEAITRVLHLDRGAEDAVGTLVEYRGTYSQYHAARAKDEERLAKMATAQAKEIARLQGIVDRFGAKATKAAMAHSVEKRIARLESSGVSEAPKSSKTLRVKFPDPPPSGSTVLTVEGLSKDYGGPSIFKDVSFDLGRGERILVLGLNGAGKTSLLRILAGETEPNAGGFHLGHQVSFGYYAQEHDNLDTNASLLDNIRRDAPAGPHVTETWLRGLLGMFGLSGDKVFQESGTLSGGEKTKLALAMLMVGRHNLLLLDEPTNNLDPGSRHAVAEALAGWKGSMVLVSHDTEFVEALAPTKVLLMPDGQVDYFSDDWLELVLLA